MSSVISSTSHTEGSKNARRYSIWVRNWSEVIGDAKHRHKFVQQSLDYTTNHDTGVQYLREKHRQYLPDAMLPADEASAST